MKLEFPRQIFENSQDQVGAEFRADRLTGMTKLIVAFRNFANSFKNGRNLETFQKKKCFLRNWGTLDRKVISHKR